MIKCSKTPRYFVLLSLLPVSATYATNGMNLEGYGPIATAMGGAAYAYDNGNAAMMNNPATLGLAKRNNRLDVALGLLGPDVEASIDQGGNTLVSQSNGDAYYMPAFGWVKKHGLMTYGVGVYGQGGMGTDYPGNTWMSDPGLIGAGLVNRAELSVGRIILPLTYQINKQWILGGSLDFVWAGMDLRMALSGAQFNDMLTTQQIGTANGTLVNSFSGVGLPLNHAYFDFSNGSDFSGRAKAVGTAAKFGAIYKVNNQLNLAATWHTKTNLQDLDANQAALGMNVDMGGTPVALNLSGDVEVKGFQWPQTFGIGAAYRPSNKVLLVADIKRIDWSNTMERFSMQFTANEATSNDYSAQLGASADFRGQAIQADFFQRWDNQTVVAVGGSYQFTPAFTARLGYNHASNPIPNQYLNALFPAITENHITAGFSYNFNKHHSYHFSLQRASAVTATNPGNGTTIPAVTSRHSQLSWQMMYTYFF